MTLAAQLDPKPTLFKFYDWTEAGSKGHFSLTYSIEAKSQFEVMEIAARVSAQAKAIEDIGFNHTIVNAHLPR